MIHLLVNILLIEMNKMKSLNGGGCTFLLISKLGRTFLLISKLGANEWDVDQWIIDSSYSQCSHRNMNVIRYNNVIRR